MTIEKRLVFPISEYKNRLDCLRNEMLSEGIDVQLVFGPENIYYLTGHHTLGYQAYQCCIVPLEGDPILIVRFLDSFMTEAFSWVEDFIRYDDHEDPTEVTVRTLKEKGLENKKVGCDDAALFFPPRVRNRLKDALGDNLISMTGLVERCRAVKSETELDFMRKAAIYTDLGIEAAYSTVTAGVTENQIAAAAFSALTEAGSEYVQIQPIVTSGWKSGLPHSTYERRVVEPGDTITIELSGTYHRYVSPLMRTAVVGYVPEKVKEIYKICETALSAVLDKMAAGVTSGELDSIARKIISDAGYYPNWRKRTGYSVGCSFPPDWGESHIVSIRHQGDAVLRPGMVIHIPIAIREYGVMSAGVSETVIVTDEGYEKLGKIDRELFIGW